MARTYRIPVAVCKLAPDLFSAIVLERTQIVAIGSNKRNVLFQLEQALEWQYRDGWDCSSPLPDLKHVESFSVRVTCRPEHFDQHTGRRRPVSESIELTFTGFWGQHSSSYRLLVAPQLRLSLLVSPQESPHDLLRHSITQHLVGWSPQEISRVIPFSQPELDHINVQVSEPRGGARWQPHLPVLAQIADPLGEPRVRGLYGRAWERDEIVRELVAKWTSGNANWLIVGEPGAGKTTVACEAIRTIERKPVTTLMETEQRPDKQIRLYWQTSGGRLISGMRYLGMWQERLQAVIRELQAIGGVLCIESLNEFLRVGGADAQSGIAAFCIPYLQRGELRLVGEATPEELDTCRRLLPDFVDQFSIFRLDTMKGPEAIKVLQQLGEPHEAAELLPSAQRTIELFHRFERYQALPGEAVHFWRKLLASSRRRHRQNQPITNPVTPQLVTQRFIQRTGLPEFLLCDEQALRHEEVCQHLEAQVIGQPAACAAAADVVIAFKAGMNDPHRPLGTLLFCGPTGVGKTELSKALATYLFGNQRSKRKRQFLRLDMSEYSGPWAADRFLLKDDGEPSVFLQQIRQQPFNVVLFDEIEKAHPTVYDILLNILDEGRVTDRYGRVTWFRSALLILTSNLGTDSTSHVGYQDEPQMGSSIEMAVRNFFRPEFFNRLDRIVTFSALTPPIIERITEKELRQLSQREGLLSKGMTMSWTPAVVKAIAQAGFDLRYGARPLQNAMETLVVVPLARWLVAHPQATGTLKLEINSAGTVDVIALNE